MAHLILTAAREPGLGTIIPRVSAPRRIGQHASEAYDAGNIGFTRDAFRTVHIDFWI